MKYIIINMKNFVKNETAIFILVVLCILSSAVIVNFAFGFYHHLKQKELDGENDTRSIGIDFDDPDRTTVTKGSLMNLLFGLDEDILDNCIIYFAGRFQEDQTEYPALDHSMLVEYMPFCIHDDVITAAPLDAVWKENSVILDGDYFTPEQVENGELVCLAPPTNMDVSNEGAEEFVEKYSVNPDGTYTVGGKDYTCIGHVDWFPFLPMVPVTTVTDDIYIQGIGFEYEGIVTRRVYETITEAVREKYGALAEIQPMELQEVDSRKFYKTLLVLCILLVGMSGLILSMLYQYVLLQRRRQLTICRICGMTRGKAKTLYFLECFFLSLVLYLLAVLFFHFVLLPYLGRMFEYIEASYSLYSYTLLGMLYMGISSVILYGMISRHTGGRIADELREV